VPAKLAWRFARSARSIASVPISACVHVPAQLLALAQQFLAGAQQVAILLLFSIRWLHDGHQLIGVELRQVTGIDPIGLDRLTAGRRNTARSHHIAVHAVGPQVALQAVADLGGFVTQPDRKAAKVALQLIQLREKTLQRGSAAEIDDLAARPVEGRAVVLGIVDIDADVEYVLVHRRLLGSRGKVVAPTF
jgi:hypothetical protein